MNKKFITRTIALSLCTMSIFGLSSAFAIENGKRTQLSTVETDGNQVANAQQQKVAVEFLKKYDTNASNYKFEILPQDQIQLNDRSDFVTASETLKLPGTTGRAATVLSVTTETAIDGYALPYYEQYLLTIVGSTIEGAAIRIAPSNGIALDDTQSTIVALGDTKKQADAIASIKKTYDKNIVAPRTGVSLYDAPIGFRIDKAENLALNKWFKANGWDLKNKAFYQQFNPLIDVKGNTKENFSFLSDEDVRLAMQADSVRKNGIQVAMIMPSTGFYYTEQRYTFNQKKNAFYIDFCASNVAFKNGEASPLFAWLIVKPDKKNKDGKLDRFYYPVTTKLSTITSDMKDYISGKTPKNAVTLP